MKNRLKNLMRLNLMKPMRLIQQPMKPMQLIQHLNPIQLIPERPIQLFR